MLSCMSHTVNLIDVNLCKHDVKLLWVGKKIDVHPETPATSRPWYATHGAAPGLAWGLRKKSPPSHPSHSTRAERLRRPAPVAGRSVGGWKKKFDPHPETPATSRPWYATHGAAPGLAGGRRKKITLSRRIGRSRSWSRAERLRRPAPVAGRSVGGGKKNIRSSPRNSGH